MSTSAGLKVNRIKAANAGTLGLLGAALDPNTLGRAAGGKLSHTRENVVEKRNMAQTLSTLGKYVRADGFDPTRTFQHVANIDNEVWVLIVDMFGKTDEEGKLEQDGALYKTDTDGTVRLHKDFFYMLLDYLEASGYPCDMRGKIKVN